MAIPGRFKKVTIRERKKAKDKIWREAEKKRREFLFPEVGFRRRPITIFLIIVALAITGAMLCGRVSHISKSPASVVSKDAVAQKDLFVISIALELFRNDCDRYPAIDEGLEALVVNPGIRGWAYNYLTLVKPDPWGSAYCYYVTNNIIKLFSSGPDKIAGTDDDIWPEPLDERDLRSWIYQSEQYAEKVRRHKIIVE
ncbi:MAG: type II secretion system protein GspG [Lentisphaerae bacterium]|nr:type II secretion system protein GspG [Lentisphaerota bacterium]